MAETAKSKRENRTITVDFYDESTYTQLIHDGKAFVEFVLAFILSLGFQLHHKSTCDGSGSLTRHSHYARIRLGGLSGLSNKFFGILVMTLEFGSSFRLGKLPVHRGPAGISLLGPGIYFVS